MTDKIIYFYDSRLGVDIVAKQLEEAKSNGAVTRDAAAFPAGDRVETCSAVMGSFPDAYRDIKKLESKLDLDKLAKASVKSATNSAAKDK